MLLESLGSYIYIYIYLSIYLSIYKYVYIYIYIGIQSVPKGSLLGGAGELVRGEDSKG